MASPVQVILESSGVNPTSTKDDNLEDHLHHLLAIDISALQDSESLKDVTERNAQLMLSNIFKLPTASQPEGLMAILPDDDTILPHSTFRFPRSMPLPKDKPMTRWDKFAKEKGIEKRKRSRLVWDEVTKDWVPRWGHKSRKKNAEAVNWLIEGSGNDNIIVDKGSRRLIKKELSKKGGEASSEQFLAQISAKNRGTKRKIASERNDDPFDAQSKVKQTVIAKQKLREMRNELEASQKFKGKARKLLIQQMDNINQMASTQLKTGIPILNKNAQHSHKSATQLKDIMSRAQVSTASFGRHDRQAIREKKTTMRKQPKVATLPLSQERETYQRTLNNILKDN